MFEDNLYLQGFFIWQLLPNRLGWLPASSGAARTNDVRIYSSWSYFEARSLGRTRLSDCRFESSVTEFAQFRLQTSRPHQVLASCATLVSQGRLRLHALCAVGRICEG